MLPNLPPEVWGMILEPQEPSILELCSPHGAHEQGFYPGSDAYDRLRLVCKLFNQIISSHLFQCIGVNFSKKAMLSRLEFIKTSKDASRYAKSYSLCFEEDRLLGAENHTTAHPWLYIAMLNFASQFSRFLRQAHRHG